MDTLCNLCNIFLSAALSSSSVVYWKLLTCGVCFSIFYSETDQMFQLKGKVRPYYQISQNSKCQSMTLIPSSSSDYLKMSSLTPRLLHSSSVCFGVICSLFWDLKALFEQILFCSCYCRNLKVLCYQSN